MNTKYKNLLNLNLAAKHAAINLDRPREDLIARYLKDSNYDNFLSKAEVTKEVERIYAQVKKNHYSNVIEEADCFTIYLNLQSNTPRQKLQYTISLESSTVAGMIALINEAKNDLKESIFLLADFVIEYHYQGSVTPESHSYEDKMSLLHAFEDWKEYESAAYLEEGKHLTILDRKDQMLHEVDDFSFKYALFEKIMLILFAFGTIFVFRQGDYFAAACGVFSVVVMLFNHQRVVSKQKIKEMTEELLKLGK